jgi:1-acyl-sn-glycerol-3-phosphate acyltransferase
VPAIAGATARRGVLARRLAHGWRALRTGVAFATFGVGAVVLAGTMLPALRLMPRPPADADQRAQRLVHLAFRLFEWWMAALGLIRVTRIGMDRLAAARPAVIVANHPTLIDVVLLIASLPQADCVVKRAAWRNRFLRGVVAGAGYIPNDEGRLLVDACAERLRAGRSVLIFPEGTRSADGRLGRFRRGAAHIALASGRDLVPVVITCAPPTLMKGQKWHDVPKRTAELVLAVQAPMSPEPYRRAAGSEGLGARRLTADLRRKYLDALGCAEAGEP